MKTTKTKRLARAGKRAKATQPIKRQRRKAHKRRRERRHKRRATTAMPVDKTPHNGHSEAPVGFVRLADAGVKLGDHLKFEKAEFSSSSLPFRGMGQVNAVNGLSGTALRVSVFNAAEGYGETLTGSDFVQKV
jgi:hypothetical protein